MALQDSSWHTWLEKETGGVALQERCVRDVNIVPGIYTAGGGKWAFNCSTSTSFSSKESGRNFLIFFCLSSSLSIEITLTFAYVNWNCSFPLLIFHYALCCSYLLPTENDFFMWGSIKDENIFFHSVYLHLQQIGTKTYSMLPTKVVYSTPGVFQLRVQVFSCRSPPL